MTTYCLTLNPLGKDAMPTWCSSWATQDGKVMVPVEHDWHHTDKSEGDDPDESIQQGADMLNAAIAEHLSDPADSVYVASHSKGSQVVGRWLIKYGPTSTFDPAKLKFVTSGNPTSAKDHVPWIKYPTPTGTAYTLIDLGRDKDGWCRWPNGSSNLFEIIGAFIGMFTVHKNYYDVQLNSVGVPTSYDSTGTIGTTAWYTLP